MPQMTLGEGGSSPGYLSEGAKGEEVRKLQEQLKAAGYDPGLVDSQFGPQTAAALKGFQQSRGLETDAVFGPLSRSALSQTAPGYTGAQPAFAGGTPLSGGVSRAATQAAEDRALQYKTGPVATIPENITPLATPYTQDINEQRRLQEAQILKTMTGPVARPAGSLGGRAEDYGPAPYTGATPQEEQRLARAVAAEPAPAYAPPVAAPGPYTGDLVPGGDVNAVPAYTPKPTATPTWTPPVPTPAQAGVSLARREPTLPQDLNAVARIPEQLGTPYTGATPQEEQRLRNAVAAQVPGAAPAAAEPAWKAATPWTPPAGSAFLTSPGAPVTATPVQPPPVTTPAVPPSAPYTGATVPPTPSTAGLFTMPTGTQFAVPGVTAPNITTPTFTPPGATPQAPTQQVTPERQALLDQLNRIQASNNPPVTYSPFSYQAPPALTYEEAQRRAAGQLNPQYQEALSDKMAAMSTQLRQTGMYGQAPTIPLTQEAIARIEAARMGAVGGQANTLMSQASQEALQQRQLAQSQWGQETSLALQAQGMNRDEAQRQVANILAVASAVDQQKAQEAGLTGYYGGQPTLQRTGQEAEMTGYYGGQPTWARQAQQAQLALSAQQAQAQAQQQAQAQTWLQQVQQAGLTGVYGGAPTLEARSAQAAAQQADIAAQQAAQQFAWQKTAQEAGLTGAYGGQPTLQARQYGTEAAAQQAALDWQKTYGGGQLAQSQAELEWQRQYQGGMLGVAQQQAAIKPTTEANLRETALQMAQKDPNWLSAYTDQARQAIIDFYMGQLQGQATTQAPTVETDWAKQGGYVK